MQTSNVFRPIALAIAALALLTSVSAFGQKTRMTKEELILRETDDQWAKAVSSKKLDKALSFYSDDALLLGPNAPVAKTKKDIRAAWESLVAPNVTTTWHIYKVGIAKSNDLAYMVGTYSLTIKGDDGKVTTDKGKLLEVWKKQKDGKWKCAVDTFNSDLPVSQ